jgi:hypothetical protein
MPLFLFWGLIGCLSFFEELQTFIPVQADFHIWRGWAAFPYIYGIRFRHLP